MDVSNFIDLHVHIGPEVLPRRYTAQKLVEDENGKIAGMALKNHFYPTMPFIKETENKKMILIGSITLNNYLGGLNPDAIYASAKLSKRPIIVWFPTINAENYLKRSEFEIRPEWVGSGFKPRRSSDVSAIKIINKDKLTEDTMEVLNAIKENNCILATGHISWQESSVLVKKAVEMGIDKIIVTHPIYQLIDMPIETQKKLVKNKGVYMEQNYAMYSIDGIPMEKIAQQIKEVGPDKCIISSDVGQVSSPSPSEAMREFAQLLMKEGITEEEIKIMGETNPRKLIEIKTK